ncbi:MAG TPA: hypothetical protein VJ824_03990, partial [Bacillota bacterium]|nr:hypothetical protein [Bacillota bacterium]
MMKNHITKSFEEIIRLREQLQQKDLLYWKNESVFTWQWWLLVGMATIPLIIWWKLVDKKRAYEIAFYGCMINIAALILDNVGTTLQWWVYPIKLEPL